MPVDAPDLESATDLFQHSPRCRLPCQIQAGPDLCFQHCQTIAGNLARMSSRQYFHHVLRECSKNDASNWQVGWLVPNC